MYKRQLEDCGVNDVAVCGLAKRLEEVWVPDDDYPIIPVSYTHLDVYKRQVESIENQDLPI